MPNWCYSNIDVEDINKSGAVAKIKAFFDDMRKHIVERELVIDRKYTADNRDGHYTDFNANGSLWLGDILLDLGYPFDDVCHGNILNADGEEIKCRGSISDYNVNGDGVLHIDTETAWVPMMDVFALLFERLGVKDDITISYYAEETMNGLVEASTIEEAGGNVYLDAYDLDSDICKKLSKILPAGETEWDDDGFTGTMDKEDMYKALIDSKDIPEITDEKSADEWLDDNDINFYDIYIGDYFKGFNVA